MPRVVLSDEASRALRSLVRQSSSQRAVDRQGQDHDGDDGHTSVMGERNVDSTSAVVEVAESCGSSLHRAVARLAEAIAASEAQRDASRRALHRDDRLVLHHGVLVELTRQARLAVSSSGGFDMHRGTSLQPSISDHASSSATTSTTTLRIDARCRSLEALLRGATLYHPPPPPKPPRSPELEARLRAIQLAHEEQDYERMTRSPSTSASFGEAEGGNRPPRLIRFFASLAAPPPAAPSSVLGAGSGSGVATGRAYGGVLGSGSGGEVGGWRRPQPTTTEAGARRLDADEEAREWREVRRQLGAVVNVALSVAGVAMAVWWASGEYTSPIQKVLTTLGASFLVCAAEAFLYARAFSRGADAEVGVPKRAPRGLADHDEGLRDVGGASMRLGDDGAASRSSTSTSKRDRTAGGGGEGGQDVAQASPPTKVGATTDATARTTATTTSTTDGTRRRRGRG